MARPRTFDRDEVLAAAMHAFRRNGLAGTRVSHLEQATGLTVGSLYNAFGDKAGLFRAAFEHYARSFARGRIDAFLGPDATLDDLEGYLLAITEPPLNDGYGCLITNAAVEIDPADPLADAAVRPALSERATRISAVLVREVGPAHAATAGPRLALLCEGMLVLARAHLLTPAHGDAVRSELRLLRAVRDQARAH